MLLVIVRHDNIHTFDRYLQQLLNNLSDHTDPLLCSSLSLSLSLGLRLRLWVQLLLGLWV